VQAQPDPGVLLENLNEGQVGEPVDLLQHVFKVSDRLVGVDDERKVEGGDYWIQDTLAAGFVSAAVL
jgi:hypothetical protein